MDLYRILLGGGWEPWGASPPGVSEILSLYWRILVKSRIYLQGFSQIFENIVQFWGGVVPDPGPVHGPWPMEKLTLGATRICQKPPRCLRMPLQDVKKTEIDIPQMHYDPRRSGEASCWTVVHLGDVNLGKFDVL